MGSIAAQTERSPLTPSERARLRQLIDQRRRELADDGRPRCAGCGCLHDERSAGCDTCNSRWQHRQWRADPAKRERLRQLNRESKARQWRRRKAAA